MNAHTEEGGGWRIEGKCSLELAKIQQPCHYARSRVRVGASLINYPSSGEDLRRGITSICNVIFVLEPRRLDPVPSQIVKS